VGTLDEQQMLAIRRGLMVEPKLLILDKVSLGLSPLLVEELFGLIRSIDADGVPLLLVEESLCYREVPPTRTMTPISSAPISGCDQWPMRNPCAPA
jgi:ABC-type histidine transport system ATPase subunit